MCFIQVTPSERPHLEGKARDADAAFSPEGAWKAGEEFSPQSASDDTQLNSDNNFQRFGSNKSLSKSKRVKSFIQRKCKDVANSFGSISESSTEASDQRTVVTRSKSTSRCSSEVSTTSWYVTNDCNTEEEVLDNVTVLQVHDTQNVTVVPVERQDEASDDVIDSRTEGGTNNNETVTHDNECSFTDSFISSNVINIEDETSKNEGTVTSDDGSEEHFVLASEEIIINSEDKNESSEEICSTQELVQTEISNLLPNTEVSDKRIFSFHTILNAFTKQF